MKEGNLLRFTVGKENFSAPLLDNIAEISPGRFAAIYNAQGHLQIVRNKASAAKQLGAQVGDSVSIRP
jgi:S-adenosylmethionine hydrolase